MVFRDRFISGNFPKCNFIFLGLFVRRGRFDMRKRMKFKRNSMVCHFHLVYTMREIHKKTTATKSNKKMILKRERESKTKKKHNFSSSSVWHSFGDDTFRAHANAIEAIDHNRLSDRILYSVRIRVPTSHVGAAVWLRDQHCSCTLHSPSNPSHYPSGHHSHISISWLPVDETVIKLETIQMTIISHICFRSLWILMRKQVVCFDTQVCYAKRERKRER